MLTNVLVSICIIEALTIIFLLLMVRRKNPMEKTQKLYVGNLSFNVTDWRLFKEDMTREVGTVIRANIVTDKNTGKSRGFAFIVVPEAEAEKFLSGPPLEYEGRVLKISPALEREDKERMRASAPQDKA